MRPHLLTLKNFMPFRSLDGETHLIDFSSLDLFAITGPTGSGKSSLIDAIVWCLYGRTMRYFQDSKGVLSAGESVCEVAFDFSIGERRFRAVRRTGKTTESGLSEWEGGEWVQDTSGAEQLTKRIETLLGLDFASFTKTVILPQGSYAEFLVSKPSERRDLLAKILELGVYSRVSDRAKKEADLADARGVEIRRTLTRYADLSREQIGQRRETLQTLAQQFNEVSAQETRLRGLVQQAALVATTWTRLTALKDDERTRADESQRARSDLAAAEGRIRSLTDEITLIVTEREALDYDPRRHDVVKRAVNHVRVFHTAQQQAERKEQALVVVHQELHELARQITDQEHNVAAARRVQQERTTALQTEIAANGDVAFLTEKLGKAKRWKELRQEQAQLVAQRDTHSAKLARVQEAVSLLGQQEAAKELEVRDLHEQREQARTEENDKARLEIEANHLGKDLQETAQEEKRAAQAVENARADLRAKEQAAHQYRETFVRAEQQEQAAVKALEESRRLHEVTHLRATLQIGEPCPVCQVSVHELPLPAGEAAGDLAALHEAVEAARGTLATARHMLQEATTVAAAARARQDATEQELTEREQKRREAQERFVARFPGFSSLSSAREALRSQRQETVALRKTVEDRAQVVEKEKQTLTQQREKAQREEAALSEALRGIAASLEAGSTQLGVLEKSLAPYLSSGHDPESLLTARRQALVDAQAEVKKLEQETLAAEGALRTLTTRKLQQEGDERVLASQRDAALAQAERETLAARENLELPPTHALPTLSELEVTLLELGQKQTQHAALMQREETIRDARNQAERQAVAVRADLEARERVLQEVRQKLQQAEQELNQTRAALQAAITQSQLSDIGADGEGLKERLEAASTQLNLLREQRIGLEKEITELERRCAEKEQEEEKLRAAETDARLAADLHKLLGAEFTDFLSQGAVEALMRDASVHLQRLTHGRYSFDIAYKRRAIELQIIDQEDHRRARPTHSLSGGETFLASLAIALALSQSFREIATGKAAKTSTECLILDEGFGTLDREGLQLVTETLQELRGEEGRMVGIITHVEEVAAAMPMRIDVRKGNRTSTITVSG